MKLEERPKSKHVLYDDDGKIVIITSYKQIAINMMRVDEKSSDSNSSEV